MRFKSPIPRRGSAAETRAARHLKSLGWTIVERNVAVPPGEIDIVAVDASGIVAFVEVRYRAEGLQDALLSVDRRKAATLRAAVRRYRRRERLMDAPCRGDLIAVSRDEDGRWCFILKPDAYPV